VLETLARILIAIFLQTVCERYCVLSVAQKWDKEWTCKFW